MFISLTESRKNRETGVKHYFKVLVNINNVTHIQPPTNTGNSYIGILGEKFMFVKESVEEIAILIKAVETRHFKNSSYEIS